MFVQDLYLLEGQMFVTVDCPKINIKYFENGKLGKIQNYHSMYVSRLNYGHKYFNS